MIGVYRIRNSCNGKVYIGSSLNIDLRKSSHRRDLRNNRHCNTHLQNAWNKYGEESFTFEVLEKIDNPDVLRDREQFWMDKHQCYIKDYGYNIAPTAGSSLGRKHTKETRAKMSKSRSGEKHHFYGKTFSEEHKEKLGFSRRGDKHCNYGKHLSQSTRKKISDSNRGRKLSSEHKIKLSESHTGKKLTKEHCNNISIGNIGKKMSNESIVKRMNTNIKNKNNKVIFEQDQIREIRKSHCDGKTIREIANEFNATYKNIWRIIKGETYNWVGDAV